MNADLLLTCAILAGTVALFVSDRLRLDVVALLSLLSLAAVGVIDTGEALAGFADPVVVMIAGLFVVGAALTETGLARWLGDRLDRLAGGGERGAILAVMLATSLLSAFMSSTGTVAIFLPVVSSLAQRRGIPPGRLFLPLAYAAHLGSLLTLISTPPNLIVSGILGQSGREPFRFFSFTPVGLSILVVGVSYFLVWGRRRLVGREEGLSAQRPPASPEDFAREYGLGASLHELRVPRGSPLVGRALGETNLRATHRVHVIGIVDATGGVRRVLPRTLFEAGDVLRVQADADAIAEVESAWGLEHLQGEVRFDLPPEESLAELVIPRHSQLVGRSLQQIRFRDRYRASVLAIRGVDGKVRGVGVADPLLADTKLRSGDTLLVKGRRKHVRNLRDASADFVVVAELEKPAEAVLDPSRAAFTLLTTFGMLLVMAFGWLPNVIAVLVAALALVLLRCVRVADVYRSVNWESVVLIAAMLPMGTALEKSGATRLIVDAAVGGFSDASPLLLLGLVLITTSVLGLFISNTATAVLIAPVVLRLADGLSLEPEPLLMGVAAAASAAFATPVSSPVNTLVMGPGGYRFADFARVGLPLQLLVLATALLVIPLFFPFR